MAIMSSFRFNPLPENSMCFLSSLFSFKGYSRFPFTDRQNVMPGMHPVIIHPPLHELMLHFFRVEIFLAELLGFHGVKRPTGINIDGNETLF